MKITVLGVGNLFTAREPNTAYLIRDLPDRDTTYLVDCGPNIYPELVEKYNNLVIGNKLEIIITHCHPDHVGGLGSLIYYMYYMGKQKYRKVQIYTGENNHRPLSSILENMVARAPNPEWASLRTFSFTPYIIDRAPGWNRNFSFEFVEVDHCAIPAYGIDLTAHDGKKVFITGDTDILNASFLKTFDLIFHDVIVSMPAPGAHAYIGDIEAHYPESLKKKIKLVHHGMIIGPKSKNLNYAHPGETYEI